MKIKKQVLVTITIVALIIGIFSFKSCFEGALVIYSLFSITKPRMQEAFAIRGYEQYHDWMLFDGRDFKTTVDDERIEVKYTCLTIEESYDSYAYLLIRNKSKKVMKILKMKWEHIFEGKPLRNTCASKGLVEKDGYKNINPPLILKEKLLDAFYIFNTSMRDDNFKVGDTVEVVIELEYEVSGKIYKVKDRIPLVVFMRYLPQSLP